MADSKKAHFSKSPILKIFSRKSYIIFKGGSSQMLTFDDKGGGGAILLRQFRLYMLSFMFWFMFANIRFEKNQNRKKMKHETIKFCPLQVCYVKNNQT